MPQSGKEEVTKPSYKFGGASVEILKKLDKLSARQMYPASVELYRQGSAPHDVYFLESGLIKLIRIEEDGRELIFSLRYPGELVGDFSAIRDKAYPLTAITLINSHVRRIPAHHFQHLLQTDIDFSWRIHQMHSQVAFDHVIRIAQLTFASARQRLEQVLWQLVLLQNPELDVKDLWLRLPLKYWELAALIGVSPAYLSRLFRQLESEGVLRRKQGRLIIRCPQKLWHESED